MQGRGNEAGMFMSSWILDVLFKKHRGIYFQKEFMSHSFKFEKNTIINIDDVYKDRIYRCIKCGIYARYYRDVSVPLVQDVSIENFYKTCNQIIMEMACK